MTGAFFSCTSVYEESYVPVLAAHHPLDVSACTRAGRDGARSRALSRLEMPPPPTSTLEIAVEVQTEAGTGTEIVVPSGSGGGKGEGEKESRRKGGEPHRVVEAVKVGRGNCLCYSGLASSLKERK